MKTGLVLVDCGKIVIFKRGGTGKGFLVDGRFGGNLVTGFLVVLKGIIGFVGLGLILIVGLVKLLGLYVGLGL